MKFDFPKHRKDLLQQKRDKMICKLDEQRFELTEIAFIFNLTPPRIYQIVNNARAKSIK